MGSIVLPLLVVVLVALGLMGVLTARRYPASTWPERLRDLVRAMRDKEEEPVEVVPEDTHLEALMTREGPEAYAGTESFSGLVDVVEKAMTTAEEKAAAVRRARAEKEKTAAAGGAALAGQRRPVPPRKVRDGKAKGRVPTARNATTGKSGMTTAARTPVSRPAAAAVPMPVAVPAPATVPMGIPEARTPITAPPSATVLVAVPAPATVPMGIPESATGTAAGTSTAPPPPPPPPPSVTPR